MLQNLLIILTAHYVADWGLQNQFMADNKGKFWIVMFSHCMLWAGVLSVCLISLELFEWWKFFFLFIFHYVIDAWKMKGIKAYCSQDPSQTKHNLMLLYIDQFLHFVQCLIVVIL
jgi:hypothetical protein